MPGPLQWCSLLLFVLSACGSQDLPLRFPLGGSAEVLGPHSARLSWNPVNGATGYVISAPAGIIAGLPDKPITDTTITLTGLLSRTSYLFRVAATDGTASSAAIELRVRTLPEAPLAPLNLSASGSAGAVQLTWSEATEAVGYAVLRGVRPGGPYQQLAKVTAPSFLDVAPGSAAALFYVVETIGESATSLPGAEVVAITAPPRELCVVDRQNNSVSVFSSEQAGNAAPLRRFGDQTGLHNPDQIRIDSSRGEIAVGDYYSNRYGYERHISFFARGAAGNQPPLRTLGGPSTLLWNTSSFVIDPSTERVIALAESTFYIFEAGASGNQRPLKVVTSTAPFRISRSAEVDPVHGELAVLDAINAKVLYFSLEELASPIVQTIAPLRILTFADPISYYGNVAIDPLHGEVAVSFQNGEVRFFDRLAAGAAAPLRTVSYAGYGAFALRPEADELWSANGYQLLVYSRSAAPGDPPLRSIQIASPVGYPNTLAIDSGNGEAVWTTLSEASLEAIGLDESGMVAPRRVLSGAGTGLHEPSAVVADPAHGELYVLTPNAVQAYPIGADGPAVAPLRTIPLDVYDARAMVLDRVADELVVLVLDRLPILYTLEAFARTGDRLAGTADPTRKLTVGVLQDPRALVLAGGELLIADGTQGVYAFGLDGTQRRHLAYPPGNLVGLTTDPDAGFLVAIDQAQGQLLTWPLGADGAVAPVRTSTGVPAGSLLFEPGPQRLFVLTPGGRLAQYLVYGSALFPLGAIEGLDTGLAEASAMAICR